MSEIELLGGELWQWDTSRRVRVEVPGATEAHFATVDSERAMVIPLAGGVVEVPDILLTVGSALAVWAADGRDTLTRAVFRVRRRAKPDGYVCLHGAGGQDMGGRGELGARAAQGRGRARDQVVRR